MPKYTLERTEAREVELDASGHDVYDLIEVAMGKGWRITAVDDREVLRSCEGCGLRLLGSLEEGEEEPDDSNWVLTADDCELCPECALACAYDDETGEFGDWYPNAEEADGN